MKKVTKECYRCPYYDGEYCRFSEWGASDSTQPCDREQDYKDDYSYGEHEEDEYDEI